MEHYIKKSALIAEIEKRIKGLQNIHKENEEKLDSIQKIAILLCIDECKVILSLINTLEVKEEVLDRNDKTKLMQKCVKIAYKRGYDMGVLQTTNKMNSNTKEVNLEKEIQEAQRNYKTIEEYKGYPCTMYANDIEWIARHFFELGLKAQKGE